jgi:putative transposase
MKSRFSERQILGFLREAAAGTPVLEVCWNHCISRSTFRAWKAKYGATIGAEVGRLKQLERENTRLREALERATEERSSTRSGAVPHRISSATLPKKRSSASSRSAPPV